MVRIRRIRVLYELDLTKLLLYVVPVEPILGKLPVVRVGNFGTVSHGMRGQFPGALADRARRRRRLRRLSCAVCQLIGSDLIPRDVVYSFVQANTRMPGNWARRHAPTRALAEVMMLFPPTHSFSLFPHKNHFFPQTPLFFFPIPVNTALTKPLTYPSTLGRHYLRHTLNAAARFMTYPILWNVMWGKREGWPGGLGKMRLWWGNGDKRWG